jgi:DNA polymerase
MKVTQDELWQDLKTQSLEAIGTKYGSVMAALSHGLRGAIIASPGKTLYVADYASIEARVVMWLAGEEHGLELFRTGADIYLDMAADIYGRVCTKADVKERGMGKIAILGLGYQMGWVKFQAQCATFGIVIDDNFAQQVVFAYREKYATIKQLWYDQEDAAIAAVRRPGDRVQAGLVCWEMLGRFLYCTLPSGRRLAYPDAQIRSRTTPWGAEKPSLTYKGVSGFSHQWQTQTAYGGMLVENITQAVARDVLAEALKRVEQSGQFTPVLTVHDEIVAEGKPGIPLSVFDALIIKTPRWANGLPIACDSWTGSRYKK